MKISFTLKNDASRKECKYELSIEQHGSTIIDPSMDVTLSDITFSEDIRELLVLRRWISDNVPISMREPKDSPVDTAVEIMGRYVDLCE